MEQLLVSAGLLLALALTGMFRIPGRSPRKQRPKKSLARGIRPPVTPRRRARPARRSASHGRRELANESQIQHLATRLSRLEAALDSGEVVTQSTPSAKSSFDTRHRVLVLSRRGKDCMTIARQLRMSQGEVELIVRLASPRHMDMEGITLGENR